MSLSMTALLYAPIAAAQWPSVVPSQNALASVATLGIVCTAIAFLLFGELVTEVGPVRATVITYVNPAVAAVLGVLVLRETFTVAMAIGFALVIAGSGLATRRPGTDATIPSPERGSSTREPATNSARLTEEG
jgi:drug/metabolite transporter (DMT)-like permease